MTPTDDLIDDSEFVVTSCLWMIAPKPRPQTVEELRPILVRVETNKAFAIMVFTDADLAYRFIEELGDKGRNLKPFSLPTIEEFATFLERLSQLGERHLAFDPTGPKVRVFPITRILDGIRNRKK